MTRWHRPLTGNELRQCLRIAFGCTTGFLLCKIFNWNYGVFYTAIPVFLLGILPVMNGHAARQLIASAVVGGVEVGLLGGLFGGTPALMPLLAFFMFLHRSAAIDRKSVV